MARKRPGINQAIRYSQAFKMTVVREVEEQDLPFEHVRRKYGIKGVGTVQEWVRKYGNGSRGKVIRVQKPKEVDEVKQLKQRIRQLESALADTNVELCVERAYTRLACERAGIKDVDGFKKKSRWDTAQEAVSQGQRAEQAGVNVTSVCRKLGISRQNFYARRRERQRRQVDEELVVAWVKQERQQQPRLGTRKLHQMLQSRLSEEGVDLGRDRMFEILREHDLLLEPQPSQYPRTTRSHHSLPVFSNEIKDLEVSQPNEVWVGDLTYLRTQEGFMYLALLTDKYSRKIVGYHCGDNLEAAGCIGALDMALPQISKNERKPWHHSDRGCQYCCHEYVKRLLDHGLGVSMTEVDHCAENALAERMNGTLKCEYGLDQEFKSKGQARLAVDQAVHLYNTRRPHTALGYRVPEQVHCLAA